MSSVELIKENISMVQAESEGINISFDKSANRYLDAILSFQEATRKMINMIDDLVDRMHTDFINLSVENYMEFRDQLRVAINILLQSYASVRSNSALYHGAKTVIKELYSSIDNLREISEDFETFKISLPADKKYQDLVNAINAL